MEGTHVNQGHGEPHPLNVFSGYLTCLTKHVNNLFFNYRSHYDPSQLICNSNYVLDLTGSFHVVVLNYKSVKSDDDENEKCRMVLTNLLGNNITGIEQ